MLWWLERWGWIQCDPVIDYTSLLYQSCKLMLPKIGYARKEMITYRPNFLKIIVLDVQTDIQMTRKQYNLSGEVEKTMWSKQSRKKIIIFTLSVVAGEWWTESWTLTQSVRHTPILEYVSNFNTNKNVFHKIKLFILPGPKRH